MLLRPWTQSHEADDVFSAFDDTVFSLVAFYPNQYHSA
jgi:hypothetical protein